MVFVLVLVILVLLNLIMLLFPLTLVLMLMLTKTRWFLWTGEPSQEATGMTPMTLSASTSLLPSTG